MSRFADWGPLLADTVILETYAGMDAYGTASYGDGVTWTARIEGGPKAIRTAGGDDVISMVRVFVGIPLTANDRLTLPSSFAPTQPALLRVDLVRDATGFHHAVAYA